MNSRLLYSYVVVVAIAAVLGFPVDRRKIPVSKSVEPTSSVPIASASASTAIGVPGSSSSVDGSPSTAIPSVSASPSGTSNPIATPTAITGPGGPVSSGNSSGASNSSGPYFVIYNDKTIQGGNGLPAADQLKGFNVLAISFWLSSGPADQAIVWQQLSKADRDTLKAAYKAAGVKVIISAFGATETPTTSKADPVDLATKLATFATENELDGVDVDYEDFDAMSAGTAVPWLVTFTQTLRQKLPAGATISHAPVAPWFAAGDTGGGGYLKVDQAVGKSIDWYNIQFYNQGATEYSTCDGLITTSSSKNPKSSLFEIAAAGVPLNKLVIGKPATAPDANNGFIAGADLAKCISTATAKQWNGGVMFWEFSPDTSALITTVRGSAFPGSGGNSTAPGNTTSVPVTDPTQTATGSAGGVPTSIVSVPSGGSDPTASTDIPGSTAGVGDPVSTATGLPGSTTTKSGSHSSHTRSASTARPTAIPTTSAFGQDPTSSIPGAVPTDGPSSSVVEPSSSALGAADSAGVSSSSEVDSTSTSTPAGTDPTDRPSSSAVDPASTTSTPGAEPTGPPSSSSASFDDGQYNTSSATYDDGQYHPDSTAAPAATEAPTRRRRRRL